MPSILVNTYQTKPHFDPLMEPRKPGKKSKRRLPAKSASDGAVDLTSKRISVEDLLKMALDLSTDLEQIETTASSSMDKELKSQIEIMQKKSNVLCSELAGLRSVESSRELGVSRSTAPTSRSLGQDKPTKNQKVVDCSRDSLSSTDEL